MAGDLNAHSVHWGDSIIKIKGNLLKRLEDNNDIQYRAVINPTDSATFPSANSFLDLCIANNRLLISNNILKTNTERLTSNTGIPNSNTSNKQILHRFNCNIPELPLSNNEYLLHKPHDILNAIGAFLETINAPRYLNENTALKRIVATKIETLTNNFQNKEQRNLTVAQFSETNPAYNLSQQTDTIYFHNKIKVHKILTTLPSRTSSGLDNIPSIVLKHQPVP
ncbi:hypothetical protein M0804_013338 [Polistes exclamans]|nr:hypothetical protein M0804_013338 [Polistes exclamans]